MTNKMEESKENNMSNLEKYVERVKEYISKRNMTEDEIVRYVYLDLGSRFSFDVKFLLGNSSQKREIYASGKSIDGIDSAMETNTITCLSCANILTYIFKALGINAESMVLEDDCRKYQHVYNVVRPKYGKPYTIDLQDDIENIQSHSATECFGLSLNQHEPPIISRFELEQIDKKLGYIDEEHYYSDDYLYLLKFDIGDFENLQDKVQFVLENIDIYENPNMKYAERYWYHKKIIKKLFSPKELNKINMIDCYEMDSNGQKNYKNCITVSTNNSSDIYMYDNEKCKYVKISIEEFAKRTKNGLVNIQNIMGLKQVLKQLEKDEREI